MHTGCEYYQDNFDEISVLSENDRCRTYIIQNKDTKSIVVKKIVDINKMDIFKKLCKIDDIHIAKILSVYEENKKCAVIEEYISGRSLYDYMISGFEIGEQQAKNYIIDLCSAVCKLHNEGIIHRDIQPKNIIISSDGVIKLIDFDISREVKSENRKDTEILGTAGYAAPEQFGFTQTDARTDIYALGVLLKFMLTGDEHAPYAGKYSRIIEKCTYIDPDKRYASAQELQNALLNCEEEENIIDENPQVKGKKTELDKQKTVSKIMKIVRTIPGYRSENIIFMISATIVYTFMFSIFVMEGYSSEYKWYKNVLEIVSITGMYMAPYTYLANIGNIVCIFPVKREYKNKIIRFAYQMLYAFLSFFIFAVLLSAANLI